MSVRKRYREKIFLTTTTILVSLAASLTTAFAAKQTAEAPQNLESTLTPDRQGVNLRIQGQDQNAQTVDPFGFTSFNNAINNVSIPENGNDERIFTTARYCGEECLPLSNEEFQRRQTIYTQQPSPGQRPSLDGDIVRAKVYFHNNAQDPFQGEGQLEPSDFDRILNGEAEQRVARNVKVGFQLTPENQEGVGFIYADNNRYSTNPTGRGVLKRYDAEDYMPPAVTGANGLEIDEINRTASDNLDLSRLDLENFRLRLNPNGTTIRYVRKGALFLEECQEDRDSQACQDAITNNTSVRRLNEDGRVTMFVHVNETQTIEITAIARFDEETQTAWLEIDRVPGCFHFDGEVFFEFILEEIPEEEEPEPICREVSLRQMSDVSDRINIFRAAGYDFPAGHDTLKVYAIDRFSTSTGQIAPGTLVQYFSLPEEPGGNINGRLAFLNGLPPEEEPRITTGLAAFTFESIATQPVALFSYDSSRFAGISVQAINAETDEETINNCSDQETFVPEPPTPEICQELDTDFEIWRASGPNAPVNNFSRGNIYRADINPVIDGLVDPTKDITYRVPDRQSAALFTWDDGFNDAERVTVFRAIAEAEQNGDREFFNRRNIENLFPRQALKAVITSNEPVYLIVFNDANREEAIRVLSYQLTDQTIANADKCFGSKGIMPDIDLPPVCFDLTLFSRQATTDVNDPLVPVHGPGRQDRTFEAGNAYLIDSDIFMEDPDGDVPVEIDGEQDTTYRILNENAGTFLTHETFRTVDGATLLRDLALLSDANNLTEATLDETLVRLSRNQINPADVKVRTITRNSQSSLMLVLFENPQGPTEEIIEAFREPLEEGDAFECYRTYSIDVPPIPPICEEINVQTRTEVIDGQEYTVFEVAALEIERYENAAGDRYVFSSTDENGEFFTRDEDGQLFAIQNGQISVNNDETVYYLGRGTITITTDLTDNSVESENCIFPYTVPEEGICLEINYDIYQDKLTEVPPARALINVIEPVEENIYFVEASANVQQPRDSKLIFTNENENVAAMYLADQFDQYLQNEDFRNEMGTLIERERFSKERFFNLVQAFGFEQPQNEVIPGAGQNNAVYVVTFDTDVRVDELIRIEIDNFDPEVDSPECSQIIGMEPKPEIPEQPVCLDLNATSDPSPIRTNSDIAIIKIDPRDTNGNPLPAESEVVVSFSEGLTANTLNGEVNSDETITVGEFTASPLLMSNLAEGGNISLKIAEEDPYFSDTCNANFPIIPVEEPPGVCEGLQVDFEEMNELIDGERYKKFSIAIPRYNEFREPTPGDIITLTTDDPDGKFFDENFEPVNFVDATRANTVYYRGYGAVTMELVTPDNAAAAGENCYFKVEFERPPKEVPSVCIDLTTVAYTTDFNEVQDLKVNTAYILKAETSFDNERPEEDFVTYAVAEEYATLVDISNLNEINEAALIRIIDTILADTPADVVKQKLEMVIGAENMQSEVTVRSGEAVLAITYPEGPEETSVVVKSYAAEPNFADACLDNFKLIPPEEPPPEEPKICEVPEINIEIEETFDHTRDKTLMSFSGENVCEHPGKYVLEVAAGAGRIASVDASQVGESITLSAEDCINNKIPFFFIGEPDADPAERVRVTLQGYLEDGELAEKCSAEILSEAKEVPPEQPVCPEIDIKFPGETFDPSRDQDITINREVCIEEEIIYTVRVVGQGNLRTFKENEDGSVEEVLQKSLEFTAADCENGSYTVNYKSLDNFDPTQRVRIEVEGRSPNEPNLICEEAVVSEPVDRPDERCIDLEIERPVSPWEVDGLDDESFRINLRTQPANLADDLFVTWEVTNGNGEWSDNDNDTLVTRGDYTQLLLDADEDTRVRVSASFDRNGVSVCSDTISARDVRRPGGGGGGGGSRRTLPEFEKNVFAEDDYLEADDFINVSDDTDYVTYAITFEPGSETQSLEIKDNALNGGRITNSNRNDRLNGFLDFRGMLVAVVDDNGRDGQIIYRDNAYQLDSQDRDFDSVGDEDDYNCDEADSRNNPCLEDYEDVSIDFQQGDDIRFTNLDELRSDEIIIVKYQMRVRSDIDDERCRLLSRESGCGETFDNRAEFTSYENNNFTDREDDGSDSAEMVVTCPFFLSRQGGDSIFNNIINSGREDNPGLGGIDIATCSPFKGSTGTGITPTPETPERIGDSGPGEEPVTPVLKKGTNGVCRFSNTEDNVEGYNNEIEGFSSTICELQASVSEKWQEENITSAIRDNANKLSRWNENITSSKLTSPANLVGAQNASRGIFTTTNDLTIDGQNGAYVVSENSPVPENQTYIINGADLIINSNIEYSNFDPQNPTNISTAAFIVIDGNIKISNDVDRIDAIIMAVDSDDIGDDGQIMSLEDEETKTLLTINGSVFGNVRNLFKNRRGSGDISRDQGSITINFDQRILLNPPPAITELINLYQVVVPE
jgi:hypothetical protein